MGWVRCVLPMTEWVSQRALMAQRAQEGHIGLASMLAKALAAGGQCDVRATSPGTEITVDTPADAEGQHGDGRYWVALTGA